MWKEGLRYREPHQAVSANGPAQFNRRYATETRAWRDPWTEVHGYRQAPLTRWRQREHRQIGDREGAIVTISTNAEKLKN